MEQLTLKEAIEQGYTHYGYADQGYQAMNDLSFFDEMEVTGTEMLFEKDAAAPFKVTPEAVKEILRDQISDEWYSSTGDDTDEMYDFLNDIPLEKF